MDGIPLPVALWPLVRRLESEPEVSDLDVLHITLIVRLGDAMHKVAYATFLTHSFVDELRQKLHVPDLDLEIDVHANRWSCRQGSIMVYHRIRWDYDGSAMHELSKIALGVLQNRISVPEAIVLIHQVEEATHYTAFENIYRRFPGRVFILPILACSGSVIFFDGTYVDLGFGLITGLAAGLMHYGCAVNKMLIDVEELLIGICTAMIAVLALTLFPNRTCFTWLVLGTLLWFLYGLAFVVSLYEVTQNLLLTGLTRFALAVLNSFILAFGVVIGVWMAAYGGPERFDNAIYQDCSNMENPVHPFVKALLYPLFSVGVFMHLRIAPKHWIISFVVVYVALCSQHLLSRTWQQPIFVSNVIPSYLSTLVAHIAIVVGHKLQLTPLDVEPTAYLQKKKTDEWPSEILKNTQKFETELQKQQQEHMEEEAQSEHTRRTSSFALKFVDEGWADDGLSVDGYVRNERLQYQRSDLWFCLLPALYILVPGSSVWRVAFFSIMQSPGSGSTAGANFSLEAMISGIFVVGIGQVIGVRLGITTLWCVQELHQLWTNVSPTKTGQNEGNSAETIPLVLSYRSKSNDADQNNYNDYAPYYQ